MAFHRIIPSLSNTTRYIGVLACVTLLLIVVVECILNAVRTGTSCCFDDAAHAVVSKNLAKGNSYLLSFDFDDLDRRGTSSTRSSALVRAQFWSARSRSGCSASSLRFRRSR